MVLDKKDLKFILELLKYTRLKFENNEQYPSYKFKQGEIKEANGVIYKVESML